MLNLVALQLDNLTGREKKEEKMARGAGKGRLFEGGDYFTYFRKRGAIIRGKRLIENLLYCLAKQVLVFLGIKEANFCWEVLSLRSKLFFFPAVLLLATLFGRSINPNR